MKIQPIFIIVISSLCVCIISSIAYSGYTYYLNTNNKCNKDSNIILCPINQFIETETKETKKEDVFLSNKNIKFDDLNTLKLNKEDITLNYDNFYLSYYIGCENNKKTCKKKIKNYYIIFNIEMFLDFLSVEEFDSKEEMDDFISMYQTDKTFSILSEMLKERNFNYDKNNEYNDRLLFMSLSGTQLFNTLNNTFYKKMKKKVKKEYKNIDINNVNIFDFIMHLCYLSENDTQFEYNFQLMQ